MTINFSCKNSKTIIIIYKKKILHGSRFLLKPDIYLKNGENNLIMDTKWKRLLNEEKFHFGIKQGDIYQRFMYAMKFDATDIWLLYPWYAKYKDNENSKYTYGFVKNDKSKELVRYSTELEFVNNGVVAKKNVNIHAYLIDNMYDFKDIKVDIILYVR